VIRTPILRSFSPQPSHDTYWAIQLPKYVLLFLPKTILFCGLFYNVVSIARWGDRLRTGKVFEGSGRGLFVVLSRYLPGGTAESQEKAWEVPSPAWTRHIIIVWRGLGSWVGFIIIVSLSVCRAETWRWRWKLITLSESRDAERERERELVTSDVRGTAFQMREIVLGARYVTETFISL
jgi:hypothetical protein